MRRLLWLICSIWEYVYKTLIRARFLPNSRQKLLKVAYRKFKREDKTVGDVVLTKGDIIAELHLSNTSLSRYAEHRSPEWALYKDLLAEFRLLSSLLKEDPRPIKALTGITILAPPAARLGFQVEEIPPGLWAWLNYFWLRFLRIAFSPRKDGKVNALAADRNPVEIWMSAEDFTEKF